MKKNYHWKLIRAAWRTRWVFTPKILEKCCAGCWVWWWCWLHAAWGCRMWNPCILMIGRQRTGRLSILWRWPGSEGPRYDCKWSLEQLSWLDWEAATTWRLKLAKLCKMQSLSPRTTPSTKTGCARGRMCVVKTTHHILPAIIDNISANTHKVFQAPHYCLNQIIWATKSSQL